MAWLMLRQNDDSETCVDMTKVVRVQAVKGGSKLHFNVIAQNAKGEQQFKTLVVKNLVSDIARALKASAPR